MMFVHVGPASKTSGDVVQMIYKWFVFDGEMQSMKVIFVTKLLYYIYTQKAYFRYDMTYFK